MEIKVMIKQVYGNELIYPVCDTAKTLAKLAKNKTITPWDIQTIKALGYKVTVVSPLNEL